MTAQNTDPNFWEVWVEQNGEQVLDCSYDNFCDAVERYWKHKNEDIPSAIKTPYGWYYPASLADL